MESLLESLRHIIEKTMAFYHFKWQYTAVCICGGERVWLDIQMQTVLFCFYHFAPTTAVLVIIDIVHRDCGWWRAQVDATYIIIIRAAPIIHTNSEPTINFDYDARQSNSPRTEHTHRWVMFFVIFTPLHLSAPKINNSDASWAKCLFGFSQPKIDKTKCCVSYVYLCNSLICFYCRSLQIWYRIWREKK